MGLKTHIQYSKTMEHKNLTEAEVAKIFKHGDLVRVRIGNKGTMECKLSFMPRDSSHPRVYYCNNHKDFKGSTAVELFGYTHSWVHDRPVDIELAHKEPVVNNSYSIF